MKNNSKRRGGFTLIEVIISMALIAILSMGVYSSYLMIIKITKGGEVKQISALIGKQISEEIKSVAQNKDINISEKNGVTILELTDQIHFNKVNKFDKYGNKIEIYETNAYFNEDGSIVNNNYKYKATIELIQKKTQSGQDVVINEVINDTNADKYIDKYNIYLIKESGKAKVVNSKPNNSYNIEEDTTVNINIKNNGTLIASNIKTTSNDLDYTFGKDKIQINLDLKYCTGLVKIDVVNETKTPLNLCILNNDSAIVENKEGVLNEYYRSEAESKIGILYDVNIEIFDEKSNESNTIFQTSFVQNIDIR